MTDKRLITEQIVRLQNELTKMQNLLEGEPEETIMPESPAFDCLAVTQVQVFPYTGPHASRRNMKALAQVVLNDQLVIRGLRVIDGPNGLFVSYPIDQLYKGEDFRSVVNPLTRQLREHIENCVLEKYQATVEQ